MLKKTLKIVLLCFLVLVAFAFAAPFLFKGKIIAIAKEQINKNLNAKVDFADVGISFFRHFPRVAVSLKDLQVLGINEFSEDTLIAAKKIEVAVNFMSFIKGSDMKIYSVLLQQPRIHAIVNKEGNVNWDITKPGESTASAEEQGAPFKMQLERYAIREGYVSYVDETANMSSEISNLNHEGSGDFTDELFTLKTKTTAGEVSFNYAGIPYLSKVNTTINTDVEVNNKTNTYTFKTDKIALNKLQLSSEGLFRLVNDSTYMMDIKFDAPSNDFRDILSLVPAVYKNDFDKIKTSGTAKFNGFVKGVYSSTSIPAYNISLDVNKGYFKYADLPKPVQNINLNMKVDNPDGITDHTVVDISKAHIEMDNDPFDFRLLLKNPVSDMYVDGAAKGKLDLSKVNDYYKLEDGTRLSGHLDADISAKGNMSAVEKKQYENFDAAGTLEVNGLNYVSKDYPDGIKVNDLVMRFNPKNVTVSEFTGQYMQTNFNANGKLDNLLAYVFRDAPLSGNLNVKADKMDLDDWMGTTSDTTSVNTEASRPFAVPANLDFVIDASVDKLHYDKLDIQNLTGNLVMKDETVSLNDVKGDALEGTMLVNGTYSTKASKEKPDISLSYEVKDLDVQKTFYAFNTVQKLMPIGQFIAGKLSSQLKMNGKLGENMMPDLSSLSGNGNLLLIEGFLKKFAPLEKMASTLNVKELESVSLKDVKNYIEFKNGKVLVKPFHVKVKDIEMEIGGMHGFDQSMDYIVNMKLPRSLLGESGNKLVNNLITQVNNKGVPLQAGETIDLNINLGGTIKNPVIKTGLKEAAGNMADQLKQRAVDFAKSKADSTKQAVTAAVKDTVSSIKKEALQGVKNELAKQLTQSKDDSTGSKSGVEDSKKKLEESGKGLIKDLFRKKKKQTDSTNQNR